MVGCDFRAGRRRLLEYNDAPALRKIVGWPDKVRDGRPGVAKYFLHFLRALRVFAVI